MSKKEKEGAIMFVLSIAALFVIICLNNWLWTRKQLHDQLEYRKILERELRIEKSRQIAPLFLEDKFKICK